MKAESAKRIAQRPLRRAAERKLGREGTQGMCARCGVYGYVNGHERRGGSRRDGTKPDCLLCRTCNGWCEEFPIFAAWTGWKVSSKHDPYAWLGDDRAVCTDGHIHVFGSVTV